MANGSKGKERLPSSRGRPENSKVAIHLRLTKEAVDQLDKRCREKNMTRSRLLSQMLESYKFGTNQSPPDWFRSQYEE